MPYCVVKDCKNYSSKVKRMDGISYFHFPRDPIRCAVWTKTIAKYNNEEYFKAKRTTYICSDHFKESDMYMTNTWERRRLLKTATPDLKVKDDVSKISEAQTVTGVSVNDNMMYDEYISTRHEIEGSVYIVTVHDDNMVNDVKFENDEVYNDTVTSVSALENTDTHNLSNVEENSRITASAFHSTIPKSPASSSSLDSILDTPRKIVIKKELRECKRKLVLRNKQLRAIKKRNKRLIEKNIALKIALKALQRDKNIEQFKI